MMTMDTTVSSQQNNIQRTIVCTQVESSSGRLVLSARGLNEQVKPTHFCNPVSKQPQSNACMCVPPGYKTLVAEAALSGKWHLSLEWLPAVYYRHREVRMNPTVAEIPRHPRNEDIDFLLLPSQSARQQSQTKAFKTF